MKKSLALIAFAGVLIFASCGQSAEEKQKKQKEEQDSIANAEAARVEMEAAKAQALNDSMAKIEKAKKDSIVADSVKMAAAKPKKKK